MRSSAAARVLKAQGFTKVVNLRGGLAAWRADNLPLVKSDVKGRKSS
jgi:rhodanese-related sulfurtransferase